MEMQVKEAGNIQIVKLLQKKFTSQDAGDFREKLKHLIDEGHMNIVINLAMVDYMDSAALGAIVTGNNHLIEKKDLTEQEGNLVVSDLSSNVSALFSMLRMDSVLKIFNNEDEAIMNLSQQKAKIDGE